MLIFIKPNSLSTPIVLAIINKGSNWIPMGICTPVAIKAHKGQFFHGLLVWPLVCINSMFSHIHAMDGLSGFKPK